MKQVIKVSIAGVSFTLDSDAHNILDLYLKELKNHYRAEENGQEIIDDIEERIAELLLEKGVKERVASCEEINSIIHILGRPYDIDAETSSLGNCSSDNNGPIQKKLYRDINNKVLGGVCSGLGAYMNIDAVFVRIIFIAVALFISMTGFAWSRFFFATNMGSSFGFMVLVYIILWIIIPPAKTVAQRCAMYGNSLGIDDIQRRVNEGVKRVSNDVKTFGREKGNSFFSVLGRVILVVIGMFLLLIGIAGIVFGSFMWIGFEVLEGVSVFTLLDYLKLGIDNPLWIKILGTLVYFLPFVGMLYAGLQLCFKFKSPKWRPGLVVFIVWIVSLLAFVFVSAKASKPYYHSTTESVSLEMPKNYDTVYIQLQDVTNAAKCKGYLDISSHRYDLYYVNKLSGKGKDGLEFIDYPNIRLIRYSDNENKESFISHVECRYNVFNGPVLFDLTEIAFNIDQVFAIKDSLITVYPNIYTVDNKYKGEYYKLYVYVPKNTVVKMLDKDNNVIKKRYKNRNRYHKEFGEID